MRGGYGLMAAMIAGGVGSSSAHTALEPPPQTVITRPKATQATPAIQPNIVAKNLPKKAKTMRELQIEKCVANGGKWYVVIRPVTLTASGSDVDELYGRIWLVGKNYRQHPLSHYSSIASSSTWSQNRRKYDIWYSKENANIGKYGGKNLSTITLSMRGTTEPSFTRQSGNIIEVYWEVKDEDGSRGGNDDEYFTLSNSNYTTHDGFKIFRIYIPESSCFDAPIFAHEKRVTINAHSNGNNRMSLNLHVQWFRNQ